MSDLLTPVCSAQLCVDDHTNCMCDICNCRPCQSHSSDSSGLMLVTIHLKGWLAGQTSLGLSDDREKLFGVVYKDLTPPHQQQSGGGPWLQSSTPLPWLPSTHPNTRPLRHSPPGGNSGASPGGLGAGCWLESMPMQPHIDRLPALLTSGCFSYVQAVNPQAALAENLPDSTRSATMALDFFSRQALGAQGQKQVYYFGGKEIDALFGEQIMHQSPCPCHGTPHTPCNCLRCMAVVCHAATYQVHEGQTAEGTAVCRAGNC